MSFSRNRNQSTNQNSAPARSTGRSYFKGAGNADTPGNRHGFIGEGEHVVIVGPCYMKEERNKPEAFIGEFLILEYVGPETYGPGAIKDWRQSTQYMDTFLPNMKGFALACAPGIADAEVEDALGACVDEAEQAFQGTVVRASGWIGQRKDGTPYKFPLINWSPVSDEEAARAVAAYEDAHGPLPAAFRPQGA